MFSVTSRDIACINESRTIKCTVVAVMFFDDPASSTSHNVMVSFRLNLYNHITRKLDFNAW